MGLTRTDPIPVLLKFNRSSAGNCSANYLANQETIDVTVNCLVVPLKHFQYEKALFIVDASTETFTGKVFVRNTEYGSSYGCPVVDVKVGSLEANRCSNL